ncbi:bifunctional phosphopantothenoylcysteine decarboxylase/phosphopantothenate--cysteine ligase CoaBC [Candidatus Synechococcus calcipolaris G9]|uniref:Coenzyme A biosynthesis bifunctional protein CoaBC n=1 Tax=Candidatus Synechococcus calcipolaris G9 TaxID=1497997 RepID=A0ABT6F1R2_9SYNE|nr:bifunctional phosphopantothenoylcysteine decarboxylase/phosphopantothenate--cysteine ligase CoaBC [Candidatus Synechococcus calcipolaris]MDG2991772.1 bifunctional phosphopantothenoylcysteine decarboxylase/phosphopantothenate--cysteine ligase CoaBC [Candidatus Synechococcus calcipolaris G9]
MGIGGGIAAYKVCQVISSLAKEGHQVQSILTKTAQAFITPLTISTLCRRPVLTDEDFWQPQAARPLHIQLGEEAQIIVIAPLTAHTLGKLVQGLADDLLTSTVLASTCPILVAPAMNTVMWQQAIIQENWQKLQKNSRYSALNPESGRLACDTVGVGRMAEPEDILAYIDSLLYTKGQRDLSCHRILITAGGTREYLDPARFIGNPASGKMGIALAQAAHHRGAEVRLIHGPLQIPLPSGIEAIAVTSGQEMYDAVLDHWPESDVLVMAAAVGDVQPENYSSTKVPKQMLPQSLPLKAVPDILQRVSQCRQWDQKIIGFAAQTGNIITAAKEKLIQKNLDMIVANPIDQPGIGFGARDNEAVLMDQSGRCQEVSRCSKLHLAHQIFDFFRAT